MRHRSFKTWLGVLLAVCLLAGSMIVPTAAHAGVETVTGIFAPVELLPMQAFAGEGVSESLDGTVELVDGTAVAWIDRAILPDSIRAFYDTLVEGTDNDGVDDILIEDVYYLDSDYTIEVATETIPLNGREPSEIAAEAEERYAPYLYAVFGALDRDHPEVFWLSNAWRMGCSYSADSATCTVSILVGISQIRAEPYPTEAAIKEGIRMRDAAIAEICRDFTWETTRYERILHFNEVLTKTNQYNTAGDLNAIGHDCRECISALTGQIGTEGPVCEGYARAFKVLCDANDIPCVLVDGTANPTATSTEGHMWNYVQVEDDWYGVDVTWNDPSASNSNGAISGHESEDWLLVGSGTVVDGRTFSSTHHLKNQVYVGFLAFTNGPALHTSAYESSLTMALNLPDGGYIYDGNEKTPQVVVKYYGTALNPNTDYSVTYSDHRNAGIATVRVSGKGSYNGTVTETFVIRQRELVPIVTVEDKIYDGTDAAVVSVALNPDNLVEGDEEIRVSGTGVFASPNAADAVKVIWTLTLEGEGSENYRLLVPEDTAATIERRRVIVRADAFEMRGTESDGWLTYTVDPSTPLVAGDRLVGKLDFDPNGTDGVYAITSGTLTNENNPNYDITFVSASLTILSDGQKEEQKGDFPNDSNPSDKGGGGLSIDVESWWIIAAGGGVALVLIIIIVMVSVRKRK